MPAVSLRLSPALDVIVVEIDGFQRGLDIHGGGESVFMASSHNGWMEKSVSRETCLNAGR